MLLARSGVVAQETPRAADVQLRAFASTVVAIERIRDEVAAELARPESKTVERQAELRAGMKGRIARAIESHGLTPTTFARFEYLVTTDDAWRAVFERRLATAREPAGRPAQ